MSKNDDKLNPLAKRFEQLEKSKTERKKNKKPTRLFVEPIDLPDINLSLEKEKTKKEPSFEVNESFPVEESMHSSEQENETKVHDNINIRPSAASFIHPLQEINDESVSENQINPSNKVFKQDEKINKPPLIEEKEEKSLSTAGVASKRLQEVMNKTSVNDDVENTHEDYKNKDISSRLKPQPETRSVSLEEIRKNNLIAKPEPKKKEKKEINPFFSKLLFCLIPAFIAFLIIVASENVKSLISQNGIAGSFYLTILYFTFLFMGVGLKFIISYYKPKKTII